ncbi:dynamin family protein [Blastococcus sp. SYSU D01042]
MAEPRTDLIDRAAALAAECERTDLQRRLAEVRRRVQSPSVRVLVVGEPKKGKSSLLNGLVGAPVCAVGDDVTTVVPTVVAGGAEPRAWLVRPPADPAPPAEDGVARERVPLSTLASRPPDPDDEHRPLRIEVTLPRKLLEGGLELVDTPGLGGVGAVASLTALDLVPGADAVLVVTDATQEFTAPEMAFLEQAAALCPNVVCALTKTDVAPEWRRIAELDRRHLADHGLDAPIFPVSSALALLAAQHHDPELQAESGLGALARHLREQVVARAEVLAARSLAHDVATVTQHLRLATRTELSGLEEPAAQEALVRELEEARASVDQLRRRSSRWQQVLADGVTDLMADIDYDLRDRSRVVTREAEEAIDADDPGALWPEFSRWLQQRIEIAVADSFVWAEQRSQYLADQVVEQFARDGGAIVPELAIGQATDVLAGVIDLPEIDDGYLQLRERFLIGVRGSYTGVLMTGLATSLAGMALINPISLAAGVLLGRKAYNDDKAQRLQRRQAEAKSVVRRHVDEVVFQVSKHLKDRLRVVQRTLRDLLSDTVEEMTASLNDAVRAAQRSTKEAAGERTTRLRTLRTRLERIDALAAEVRRPAASPAAAERRGAAEASRGAPAPPGAPRRLSATGGPAR